jgi:hypothetical protein
MDDNRHLTRARPTDNSYPAGARRTFAGEKFDWLTALNADPLMDARAFKVGFCIMQHVNQHSGKAFLSDETIADKTNVPIRSVQRARAALRDRGWLAWRRTRTANVYWSVADNMNAVTDHQTMLKDARDEKRKRRREAPRLVDQDPPPVADLSDQVRPRVAELVRPRVANQVRPRVADIHLSGTPESEHLNKEAEHSVEQVDREPSHDCRAVKNAVASLPQVRR